MNRLEFTNPILYSPNLAVIPEGWERCKLEDIDFTGIEQLKELLIAYFEKFSYEGSDSIVFYPKDSAFKMFVAIYREIACRLTVDRYLFINWPSYVAYLKSLRYEAEQQLLYELFGKDFVFIFDLTLITEEAPYFERLLEYCYTSKTRILICTRILEMQSLQSFLTDVSIPLFKQKFLTIKFKS